MSDRPEDTTALDGDGSEQSDTDSQRGRATSNRRQFIALGAGATTVLLAGCSSGDSGENGNASSNGNESENGNDDPEPAELAVSSLDIAGQGEEATVQSGSDSEVAVTVENVGERSGSFDVMLSASGVSQSQTVELAGGESQTVTFEGLVSELESGTQSSFSVAADGEEVSGAVDAAVTVEEPGEPAMLAFSGLDIAGQGPVATVEGGGDGAVTVTVENVGEQSGSFDVTLSADSVSESQTVELAGGESQTVTFEGAVAALESGTSALTVAAGDAETSGQVTVGGSTTAVEEFQSQFTGGTAYEFETTSPQGSTTGRFRDGNQYLQFESSEGAGEFYFVDGAVYSVQGDQCIILSSAPVDPTEPPEEDELDEDRLRSVTRVGTETIDGEEVIVYEVSATNFGPGDATYYLLADTGRLRRMVFETQQGRQQIDFLAWGDDVDPITPPDMNCRNPRNAR